MKKKDVNFCWIFVGGSLFLRDLIIADQWKIFEIRRQYIDLT